MLANDGRTKTKRGKGFQKQEIQLTLTLTELDQILAALGEKSYKEVFQLVSKIQAQAYAQLNAAQAAADGQNAD